MLNLKNKLIKDRSIYTSNTYIILCYIYSNNIEKYSKYEESLSLELSYLTSFNIIVTRDGESLQLHYVNKYIK